VKSKLTRRNRGERPETLEKELMHLLRVNVVGNIHLFSAFIPLIRQGQAKKVIAISSGQAALEMIPKLQIELSSLYAISKAALNTAVAKFSAQYNKEGILFMSICPGLVDTGRYDDGMYSISYCLSRYKVTNIYPI
jgi:NAD(P)-dependent dehydrogenase (short-subunit alcohol dehydrogenase family)